MQHATPANVEDFRGVLRKKALTHSLFYLRLGEGINPNKCPLGQSKQETKNMNNNSLYVARARRGRVSALVKRFTELDTKDYLQPPRTLSPVSSDDICSSDDEDRLAVRGRLRELSDDSAVEVEPKRRPKPLVLTPKSSQTLVESHDVELGRRASEGEEGKPRTVRTPSVVVSDYSEGEGGMLGATLRSRALSADSACSSCSTLSSREDDEYDEPASVKKM